MAEIITHLVVDTETLGNKEHAVVLSIAVVPFQFETYRPYAAYVRDGFFVKFDATEQIKKWKRETSQSTLDWWKEQTPEAKVFSLKPSKDDVDMRTGLGLMTQYIKSLEGFNYKQSYAWARGTDFDFPKIGDMYDQIEEPLPYKGGRVRDIRTYIDILTGATNGRYEVLKPEINLKDFVAHHALHDAAKDAYACVEIYLNNVGELPPF
jgi:hypothetical protein